MTTEAITTDASDSGFRVAAAVRENLGLIVALTVWLLFLANFAVLDLQGGDAPIQYAWVQRLFGDPVQPYGFERTTHAIGYFFGLGLVEAPFYGIGKILHHLGVDALGGVPIERSLVALGTGLYILPAGAVTGRLIRDLRLRGTAIAVLAATFGTSLVFWAVFSPGKNHPADAALFSGVVYLTFRYFRSGNPSPWLIRGLGALLGFSITVRYFAGAEAVALAVVLAWYRRWRHAVEIAATTAITTGLLCLIPLALGTPITSGVYAPSQQVGFYPLNPLRMLLTDHRGLFVWSPVTALAVLGLALLYIRRPEHRPFLVAAYAMGLAIIGAYAFVPFWDGIWSFGQRYFSPLFPLVALGLAGLLDATVGVVRRTSVAAILATVAWSLFLLFNLIVDRPLDRSWKVTLPVGAFGVASLPANAHTSAGEYAWAIYYHSRLVNRVVPWPFGHKPPH